MFLSCPQGNQSRGEGIPNKVFVNLEEGVNPFKIAFDKIETYLRSTEACDFLLKSKKS